MTKQTTDSLILFFSVLLPHSHPVNGLQQIAKFVLPECPRNLAIKNSHLGNSQKYKILMKVLETTLNDVKIIEPDLFGDDRGFFQETWNQEKLATLGITANFVQDNHSRSSLGVLRGLHYQIKHPQGKLVRVTRGEVFDVAVDMRRSSPDFGKSVGVLLSESNNRQLWVPEGFAHGFYVVSESADFQYKCTDYYHPEFERSLQWDDKEVGIDWPISPGIEPKLAAKDAAGLPLSQCDTFE